jgi:hypothetical protein
MEIRESRRLIPGHRHTSRHAEVNGYGIRATFIDDELTEIHIMVEVISGYTRNFTINHHPKGFLDALIALCDKD